MSTAGRSSPPTGCDVRTTLRSCSQTQSGGVTRDGLRARCSGAHAHVHICTYRVISKVSSHPYVLRLSASIGRAGCRLTATALRQHNRSGPGRAVCHTCGIRPFSLTVPTEMRSYPAQGDALSQATPTLRSQAARVPRSSTVIHSASSTVFHSASSTVRHVSSMCLEPTRHLGQHDVRGKRVALRFHIYAQRHGGCAPGPIFKTLHGESCRHIHAQQLCIDPLQARSHLGNRLALLVHDGHDVTAATL